MCDRPTYSNSNSNSNDHKQQKEADERKSRNMSRNRSNNSIKCLILGFGFGCWLRNGSWDLMVWTNRLGPHNWWWVVTCTVLTAMFLEPHFHPGHGLWVPPTRSPDTQNLSPICRPIVPFPVNKSKHKTVPSFPACHYSFLLLSTCYPPYAGFCFTQVNL